MTRIRQNAVVPGTRADGSRKFAARGAAGHSMLHETVGEVDGTAGMAVHRAYTRPESLTLVANPRLRQSGEFLFKAQEFASRQRLGCRTGRWLLSLWMRQASRSGCGHAADGATAVHINPGGDEARQRRMAERRNVARAEERSGVGSADDAAAEAAGDRGATPDAGELMKELLAMRATLKEGGRDTYAAGEGTHDDLVIALALAVWRAQTVVRKSAWGTARLV